jgi:hypothetical protein
MSIGQEKPRNDLWPRRIAATALLLAVAACNPYDAELIRLPPKDMDSGVKTDAGEDSSTPIPKPDASGTDGSTACVPSTEICNGIDDDCDEVVDNKAPSQLDCESRLLHIASVCESGVCVRQGECFEGYRNCDGNPSNGCEPLCECGLCDDAGADDGGANDGG